MGSEGIPHQKDIERLWQHGMQENDNFNERLNFFLLFESILIAGSVSMHIYAHQVSVGLKLCVEIVGILVTLLWFYIQWRQKWILDKMSDRFSRLDQQYAISVGERDKWPFRATTVLTFLLIPLVLIMWVVILCQ